MSTPAGLSASERRMWEAFPYGENVDFRTGGPADDPEYGDRWGASRLVRAEILVKLLCGEVPVPAGDIGSVRLVGAGSLATSSSKMWN